MLRNIVLVGPVIESQQRKAQIGADLNSTGETLNLRHWKQLYHPECGLLPTVAARILISSSLHNRYDDLKTLSSRFASRCLTNDDGGY